MNFRKRWISILVLVVILAAVIMTGLSVLNKDNEESVFSYTKKETINLWYTDEALTDYLLSKAVAFNENNDIRVEVKLVDGLDYLEQINKASINDNDDEETPDIFIITNDSLEKAYLAGLATEITNDSYILDNNLFCDTARNAVTYKGKYVGYPFSFETSALLYNKTYLDSIATEGELENSEMLIPSTIVDILNFADRYSAPENVEYFFTWDVSDIFYNYFFIGDSISVGGDSGDDEGNISIYNTDSISSMMVYQELNQFFSIEADNSNYESIMKQFVDGQIIYTLATSDCLSTLTASEIPYEYGIAPLPNITDELKTKGMSVTNALVVNGYSLHKDAANEFVAFIYDNDTNCELYSLSGKMPAWKQKSYSSDLVEQFYKNYTETTPIPKMVKTSNFWIELEACFARVWGGADANTEMRTISAQIRSQISGEDYTEEALPDPEVELIEVEEYVEE